MSVPTNGIQPSWSYLGLILIAIWYQKVSDILFKKMKSIKKPRDALRDEGWVLGAFYWHINSFNRFLLFQYFCTKSWWSIMIIFCKNKFKKYQKYLLPVHTCLKNRYRLYHIANLADTAIYEGSHMICDISCSWLWTMEMVTLVTLVPWLQVVHNSYFLHWSRHGLLRFICRGMESILWTISYGSTFSLKLWGLE